MCDGAAERDVLATTAIAQHLPPWAEALDPQERPVRGLDLPLAVVRLVLADPGPEARRDPVCGIALSADAALAPEPSQDGERFCSESCLDTWRREAGVAGYVASSPAAGFEEARKGD